MNTIFLAFTKCRKAVCCFTGLADDHCKAVGVKGHFSVTEFGSELYPYRDMCKILNHILCCHSYVISGAAGYDIDLLDVPDAFFFQANFTEVDLSILEHGIQRIQYCLWLFMDLFHHEMLISGFFRCFCIPFNGFQLSLDLISIKIVEGDFAFFHTRHLQISDIIYIAGVFQDRRYVRSDKGFIFCHSKDHGAVFSGYIYFTRIILEHDRKGIGTTDTYHGMCDGIHRCSLIFLVIIIDQLDCYLGIGLRIESIAFTGELIFQFLIVLNDAVVDCYDITIVCHMRMCIVLRGFTMSCPSGMTDTTGSWYCLSAVCLF